MFPSSAPIPVKGYASGTSSSSNLDDTSKWMQWKQQLTAYVAWVNSQLKKKPGAHLVEDLRHDVKDGVALADLVEVIAGEKLSGIYPAPSTREEMRSNVELVLHFMAHKHIKMHHITTRDIVEGNLKAIMRLILAMAAHYKPNSVRHSASATNKHNITGIAQGAAAALTEARRNATRAGRHRRRRQKEQPCSDEPQSYPPSRGNKKTESSKMSQRNSKLREVGHATSLREEAAGRAELEGASASTSPSSSHNTSPRASLYLSEPSSSLEGLLSVATASGRGGSMMATSCESDGYTTDSAVVDMYDSLKDTRQMLFQLHELLLNGDSGDGASSQLQDVLDGGTPHEKISVLKGRLLHSEELSESQRAELVRAKSENVELQGTMVGLEQRLGEQEAELAQVKSELMTLELERQRTEMEMESLRKQFVDREQVLVDVKASFLKQIDGKDKVISELRRDILKLEHTVEMVKEQAGQQVKDKVIGLVADIQKVDKVGAQLEAKLSSQDQRMSVLADHFSSDSLATHKMVELESLHQSLASVRAQVAEQPSVQSLMDIVELNLSHLLDRLAINGTHQPLLMNNNTNADLSRDSSISNNRRTPTGRGGPRAVGGRGSPGRGSPQRGSPSRRGQPGAVRGQQVSPRASPGQPWLTKQPVSKSPRSHIPVPNGGSRGKTGSPPNSEGQTTVVYFTQSSNKPVSCVIPKKLGEIRLHDLKAVVQDSNLYHFYFKALDPDYGTVKEEVTHDDDILPGWEGKIVAWLELEEVKAC